MEFDPTQVYITITQMLYLATGGIAVVASFYTILRRPELIRRYRERQGRRIVGFLGCAVLAGLILAPVVLVIHGAGEQVVEGLVTILFSLILAAGLALAVYPPADEMDREARRSTKPGPAGFFFVLAVGTLLWTFACQIAFSLVFKVETSGNLVLETFSLPGEPSKFALLCLTALAAAVGEEVLFRGGVQGFLEKRFGGNRHGVFMAIVATSALWAFGHAGYLEPHGLKELQIFVLGLIWGWARLRYGLAGAIGLHLINNGTILAMQVLAWALGFDVSN